VILIAIVVFFLLLVTPSELLHLCYYLVRDDSAPSFELALVFANVLQTANFALNFLLYCACNSQFRDTWKHLFDFVSCAKLYNIIHECPVDISLQNM